VVEEQIVIVLLVLNILIIMGLHVFEFGLIGLVVQIILHNV